MDWITPKEVSEGLLDNRLLFAQEDNPTLNTTEDELIYTTVGGTELRVDRGRIDYTASSFLPYKEIGLILTNATHINGGHDLEGNSLWNFEQNPAQGVAFPKDIEGVLAQDAWEQTLSVVQSAGVNIQCKPYLFQAFTKEDLKAWDQKLRVNDDAYKTDLGYVDMKSTLENVEDVYYICFTLVLDDLYVFGSAFDFSIPTRGDYLDHLQVYGSAVVSKNGIESFSFSAPVKLKAAGEPIALAEPDFSTWVQQATKDYEIEEMDTIKQIYLSYIVDVDKNNNLRAKPYWMLVYESPMEWENEKGKMERHISTDVYRFDPVTGLTHTEAQYASRNQ